MNSEPKSIFTSKKDFEKDFGSLPERKSPNNNIAPTVLPSVDDAVVKAGQASAVEASTHVRQASRQTALVIEAGSRSRGDDLASSQSQSSFNASQPAQVPISTNPTTEQAFRKPGLPLPHTTNSTSTNASTKRPREEHGIRPVSTERSSKRNRPKLRPPHTLDADSFHAATALSQGVSSPPSPLFFSSHRARSRPTLPSFASSDAASMMSKARDEPGGVTTLKLARGSISSASPPRSVSTTASWSSMPRSPAARSKSTSGLQILSSVGIIELLDQDERPTFIIDVANSVNFTPGGPLQIVFANAALCAYESTLDMVTGKTDLNSPGVAVTNDFPEFKAWALSFVKNGETLDICLPQFVYGGVTWTCSTLRRRLRLISGSSASIVTTATSASSTGALSTSSILSDRHVKGNASRLPRSPLAEVEPSDYFGDAAPPIISTASTSPLQRMTSPIPMVEEDGEIPKQEVLVSQGEAITSAMIQARYLDSPSFDWTRLPMSVALPRHVQFARSIDWAATPLGPIENWTFDLRAMCNLIMGSPHPAAMYWGSEYVAIYNEAYILLAGQKHPQLMVRNYCFHDIYHPGFKLNIFIGSKLQDSLVRNMERDRRHFHKCFPIWAIYNEG